MRSIVVGVLMGSCTMIQGTAVGCVLQAWCFVVMAAAALIA